MVLRPVMVLKTPAVLPNAVRPLACDACTHRYGMAQQLRMHKAPCLDCSTQLGDRLAGVFPSPKGVAPVATA